MTFDLQDLGSMTRGAAAFRRELPDANVAAHVVKDARSNEVADLSAEFMRDCARQPSGDRS